MRESELLRHISARSAGLSTTHPGVVVGPGDDCAVIRVGDAELLLKVDQLVEGRHFARGTPIDRIARKAMARPISDIAAMGGQPSCALAACVLPKGFAKADQLFDAVHAWALKLGAPVVGGDISTSEDERAGLVLSISVVGVPHAKRGPVLRSGARVGDEVWVTGAIGDSFASGRHLTFSPRVREGAWLCDTLGESLHAMLDISDGLGRDAGRIAEASGVRVVIESRLIPLHARSAGSQVGGEPDAVLAASEGEDHELLFCVAPRAIDPMRIASAPVALSRIGRVESGAGCALIVGESVMDAGELGWDH
ncbi:MAG: thiamine-phosphate kinase [Phycisphaerales bacterium]|nr:thiamine-phosphate kinase [Phycisphaerales bacterium]